MAGSSNRTLCRVACGTWVFRCQGTRVHRGPHPVQPVRASARRPRVELAPRAGRFVRRVPDATTWPTASRSTSPSDTTVNVSLARRATATAGDPGYVGTVRHLAWPFSASAPHFREYLRGERGLRWPTVQRYADHLRALERYLGKTGIAKLSELTAWLITEFLTTRASQVHARQLGGCGSVLRVFLRYLHREEILARDLSRTVPRGRVYRNAAIPRAIPWSDVERTVTSIDRRAPLGRRDYAILLLLATYGLRANEVASLKLEDIDWASARFTVADRKAGNTTVYPLADAVGDAIVTYLREGRPKCNDRHVFLTVRAPFRPLMYWDVSQRAAWHLRRAGVRIPRAGSHTLRHSCVQRLVEADVPFKVIGDYIGHRTDVATQIYAKVAVHKLRPLAVGAAEDIL